MYKALLAQTSPFLLLLVKVELQEEPQPCRAGAAFAQPFWSAWMLGWTLGFILV